MPVRFLQTQSREARTLLITALLVPLCAASTAAARWSAPTRPAGCSAALAAAAAPSVVFPSAAPTVRSGPGALLWTAPRGCAAGATAGEAFGATLAGEDIPGVGQPLAPAPAGLEAVTVTAGTATGQVVAVGSGALTEGMTAGAFSAAQPLGGPAAPVAAASGYLGDVVIASPVHTGAGWAIAVRVQRHYSESPTRARLVPVGASPVEAVAATMDYRAEVLLVWASGGTVYARELSPEGALGAAQRLGRLPTESSDLELRALVSDDGHAIVAWRSQSVAPAGAPTTTVTLSISGSGLAFGAPRVLERFRDLGGFVPAGSLRLLRLSSEAVMIAWTGVDADRYVVRASPVSLRRGAWAPVVISGLGQTGANRAPAADAILADLAAGPDAEAFALWRVAPTSGGGAPNPKRWAIRAARGHYAGPGEVSFSAPELVAPPGPNGPPTVAVDPASGHALAAWATLPYGDSDGRIEYALTAEPPSPPSATAVSTAHAAHRAPGHSGTALVIGLRVLALLALAGALLLGIPRRPGHVHARRG